MSGRISKAYAERLRAIESVPCPKCGAFAGSPCIVVSRTAGSKTRKSFFPHSAREPRRPPGRIDQAWLEQREESRAAPVKNHASCRNDILRLIAEVRRLRALIVETPARPGDDPRKAGSDDPKRAGIASVRARAAAWIALEAEARAIREEATVPKGPGTVAGSDQS